MSILAKLQAWWSQAGVIRAEAVEAPDGFDVEQFIYVRIPGDIPPMARGAIEDRIEPRLTEADLGEISGGGSLLGAARADGSRPIEFCGIDIDTSDRERALALLRGLLPTLDVPTCELHYTRDGERLLDRCAGGSWAVGLPRAQLHPGFGI